PSSRSKYETTPLVGTRASGRRKGFWSLSVDLAVFLRRDLEPVAGVEVGEDMPLRVRRTMHGHFQPLTLVVVVFFRLEQVVRMWDRLTDFPAMVLQNLDFPVHGSIGIQATLRTTPQDAPTMLRAVCPGSSLAAVLPEVFPEDSPSPSCPPACSCSCFVSRLRRPSLLRNAWPMWKAGTLERHWAMLGPSLVNCHAGCDFLSS